MKSLRQIRSAKRRAARLTMRRRKDTGAAAVEFVLVLPILLALVFGIIYFGYIFAAQISLNSSARDAARAGVVRPRDATVDPQLCSAIATAARSGAATIGLDPMKVVVSVTGPAGTCNLAINNGAVSSDVSKICSGSSGQLVVTLNYTAASPVPLLPLSSVNLIAKGAFQCEYNS